MANSSSIPPDIVRVTAPILFGPMINWALYGVLCVQTYVYSYNFPDDRRALKFLAYFIFLFETVQTALTGADVYYWFMVGFGDLNRLRNSNFSAIDSPTIDAFISLIIQGFFCYRIWTLNKRMWWLCLIIAILSVTQAVGAAWGGIKSATLGRYAVIKSALYLWLVTSAVVDILIAVAMTLLLRQVRRNEGRFSNYVFPRVVRLTIETNSLTASVALVSLILYVAFPNEIYYTCPTGVIGKLYSNSLFVTLNNRIYFRDHPSPGSLGDSENVAPLASGNRGGRRLAFSAQLGLSQSITSTGTSIRLHELPPPTDPEKGKNDSVTTTSPVTLQSLEPPEGR
ncbi:hypothetical protein EDB92DRAFT_208393 [Lactarius akahatsu]|uniref:DUF6534 domain-containing protein n=1 Tax=Lactarius akahatsu TaxID=416441 RepID=A0AAD4LLQ1_9AGAM|nr:hypothetical protein EDB92DRAFT_208393 [Lactarius akahatsu]